MAMNSYALALTLASLSVLTAGCETIRTVQPSNVNSVPIVYDQGVAILTSKHVNTVIVRLTYPVLRSRGNRLPAFYIGVLNAGTEPIDFSTANVTITSGTSVVHVYTYEELEERIERQANTARALTALGAGLQSASASMPQQSFVSGTVNTNAQVYGSNGSYASGTAVSNYTGTATTYDPAASAAAVAQIDANESRQMRMIEASRDMEMNQLQSILRRNTVSPGMSAGGLVAFEPGDVESNQPLQLRVELPEELHEFYFDVPAPR